MDSITPAKQAENDMRKLATSCLPWLEDFATCETPHYSWGATLKHRDGLMIRFSAGNWNKPGQCQVGMDFPNDWDDNNPTELYDYGNEMRKHIRPSIGVAKTKDPKRIAGDIMRRLMPDALKFWELAKKREDSTQAYKKAREDQTTAALEVFAPLGATRYSNKRDGYGVSWYESDAAYGEVEACGAEYLYDIRFKRVSLAVLKAIGKALEDEETTKGGAE